MIGGYETVETFFGNLSGVKLDFGCGVGMIWEGFIGVDVFGASRIPKECRDRYRQADWTNPEEPIFSEFAGLVCCITIRHLITCTPREKVLQALKNVYNVLKVGGYLLIAECDMVLFLQAVSRNDVSLLGKEFTNWVRSLKTFYKIQDEETWETLLNCGMRGQGEILWRYSQRTLIDLLKEGGFQNPEYLPKDDKRASKFTHGYPDEDMVFLLQK